MIKTKATHIFYKTFACCENQERGTTKKLNNLKNYLHSIIDIHAITVTYFFMQLTTN